VITGGLACAFFFCAALCAAFFFDRTKDARQDVRLAGFVTTLYGAVATVLAAIRVNGWME